MGKRHTRARSVCIASATAVTWSCILCTRDAGRPSLSSWLSCERLASFGLHIRIVFDRIAAFLARKQKPATGTSLETPHCIRLIRRCYLASFVLSHFMLCVFLTFLKPNSQSQVTTGNLSVLLTLPLQKVFLDFG